MAIAPRFDRTLVIKIDGAIDDYIDKTAEQRGSSRAAVVREALLNERRRSAGRSVGRWDSDVVARKA